MMTWINKKRNKKGFTLIELIVVIAILGILAAIAVPRLTGAQHKAAVSAHNSNVVALESAAEIALANGETFKDNNDIYGELVSKGYLSSKVQLPLDVGENSKGTNYAVKIEKVEAEDGTNLLDVHKITVTPGKIDIEGEGEEEEGA